MYRVRFYSNGVEIGPYIDFAEEVFAKDAVNNWTETINRDGFTEYHTATITKI